MTIPLILLLGAAGLLLIKYGPFSAAAMSTAAGEAAMATTHGTDYLEPSDIAAYAQAAGFSGNDLVTAVAVALAESHPPGNPNVGDPSAHGDLNLGSGRGSFGLWQIYSDAHPEFGPDFETLYDPQTNANAAFKVYKAAGSTFRPWSTFKSGLYASFLDTAASGVGA